VALLAYVSVGAGGPAGGWVLISLGLLGVGLFRARRDPEQAAIAAKIASRATMLLPGALVVYLAFNDGGFFPEPPALVAVFLALLLAGRLLLGLTAVNGAGGRVQLAVTGAFVAYAAWSLASAGWSGSPERALTSVDYILLYALAFVLFTTTVTSARDVRWVVRGLALGSSIVCVFAFLSRAAPKIWSISATLETPRLSYPLTYWNALGLLAALGIVLCVGLTCDDREPRVIKALSAMAIPVLGVTLLLTFSRGPIIAGGVGLIAYLLIGRPRSLLTAALAVAPTAAVAVLVAYRATSLQQIIDGSASQAAQGHHVLVVVLLCTVAAGLARLLLAGVDPRLVRLGEGRQPMARNATAAAWAAAICVAVVVGLVAGLPRLVDNEYNDFVQGDILPAQPSLRSRLTTIGADGRVALWKVALKEFDSAPVVGTGAGTFAVFYAAHREQPTQVVNAHSLYFENLGELGVIGLGLVILVVLGSLFAIGRRTRRPDRTLYAAALAAALVWTIHAGFDWDWQMPAVTLPIFVLAGCAAARPTAAGPERAPRLPLPPAFGQRATRRQPVLAVIVLLVGLAPALLSVSQNQLDASVAAFGRNDCASASTHANHALALLSFRHAAHEILAYCDAARGNAAAALTEMTAAVDDDPKDWEPQYGLAVIEAAAGRDPRQAARAAVTLDRYEPVVDALASTFRRHKRSEWAIDAQAAPLPVNGQYGTALVVLAAGEHQPPA
jgi:hypothetical protein